MLVFSHPKVWEGPREFLVMGPGRLCLTEVHLWMDTLSHPPVAGRQSSRERFVHCWGQGSQSHPRQLVCCSPDPEPAGPGKPSHPRAETLGRSWRRRRGESGLMGKGGKGRRGGGDQVKRNEIQHLTLQKFPAGGGAIQRMALRVRHLGKWPEKINWGGGPGPRVLRPAPVHCSR